MHLLKHSLLSSPLLHEKPPNNKSRPSILAKKKTSFNVQASLSSLPPSNIKPQPTQETEIKGRVTKASSSANSCPLTPIDFLERASVLFGDCPSVLYHDAVQTWSETRVRCLKLASSIASTGIEKGDVVSVVAPNVPAMLELHFAVPMSGATLNTINLRLDARAISNILQHCESKLVFVDCQSALTVIRAVSMFPSSMKRPVLVIIPDDHVPSDTHVSSQEQLARESSDVRFDMVYEDMVERGDPGFKWVRPESEWEPITLNYTSGTTSSPKGVVHCHRGAFLIAIDSLLNWSVPNQPVYLWTLPMFHVNGWGYAWSTAAVGGANVCLRRVDAETIYEAIGRYGVTHMCAAPVVMNMLANFSGARRLERPVHIMTAGAPPPAAVLGRAEALGFVVSHGYGLTETGGLVVTCAWRKEWDGLSAEERARLKARQGWRSIAFSQMDVVDQESPTGSIPRDGSTMGEIVLRGGSVMLGYLKDTEATSMSMREDGWFYTGDVGVVHPDGYVEVKDRSKDVIICGGENLSSVEIEAALYSHPAVDEAAVVARPDKFWGETPCAFVSLKPEVDPKEQPSEKEIREFCKTRLPLYMVPRDVVFLRELPRTSTGKLQKFLLRDMAKELGKKD